MLLLFIFVLFFNPGSKLTVLVVRLILTQNMHQMLMVNQETKICIHYPFPAIKHSLSSNTYADLPSTYETMWQQQLKTNSNAQQQTFWKNDTRHGNLATVKVKRKNFDDDATKETQQLNKLFLLLLTLSTISSFNSFTNLSALISIPTIIGSSPTTVRSSDTDTITLRDTNARSMQQPQLCCTHNWRSWIW